MGVCCSVPAVSSPSPGAAPCLPLSLPLTLTELGVIQHHIDLVGFEELWHLQHPSSGNSYAPVNKMEGGGAVLHSEVVWLGCFDHFLLSSREVQCFALVNFSQYSF